MQKMNDEEARSILLREMQALTARSYVDSVSLLEKPIAATITAPSGTEYGIEYLVVYDSGRKGNLRIIGSIDDGRGWRALAPLTETVIMKPDGTLHTQPLPPTAEAVGGSLHSEDKPHGGG